MVIMGEAVPVWGGGDMEIPVSSYEFSCKPKIALKIKYGEVMHMHI